MSTPPRCLVVLPTYNERDNLEAIVAAILEHLPVTDLLVVDDASPDGTGEVADRLAKANSQIHVLHRKRKDGLGKAYMAGFRWGLSRDYQYLFEIDADFSHDPKMLPILLHEAEMGADLVLGSRYTKGGGTENWGLIRRGISRVGNIYARLVLNVPLSDLTGGYKCFRRQALETITLEEIHSGGYAFQIEMTYRALRSGFRVVEVPIRFVDRRVGQSKMSKAIVAEALWVVWRLRLR